jgi:predicted membrane channel-forming protein YqfA (hemolysin III family)
MEDFDPAYKEAKRHVDKLRGFYSHASTYVLVIGSLTALNLLSNPGHLWVQWAAFGWGIGLAAHGLSVFAFGGLFGVAWEERKIQEYLAHRQANPDRETR